MPERVKKKKEVKSLQRKGTEMTTKSTALKMMRAELQRGIVSVMIQRSFAKIPPFGMRCAHFVESHHLIQTNS